MLDVLRLEALLDPKASSDVAAFLRKRALGLWPVVASLVSIK
jgi:hypothetical protein